MSTLPGDSAGVPRAGLLPVYGAGFAIASSASSIAANLASCLRISHGMLLTLGLLLALYPAAELLLKPLIRALFSTLGVRGVLLGGLVASAVASGAFTIAEDAFGIGLARLGQGAAAAAVGLSADAVLTRLTVAGTRRSFGGYRTWKAAGYTLGPLLGGILVAVGGHSALFLLLAVLAAALTAWAALAVPTIDTAAPASESTTDLVRALFKTSGVRPALALAAGTAAVSISLGFLPVLAAQRGLGVLASGALVSALVAVAASVQLPVRRLRDAGKLADHTGIGIGLLLVALASIRGLTDSVRTFRFWSGSFCCGRQLAAGLPSFSCGVLGLGLAAVVRMSRFVGVGVRSCCATVQASVGPRASGRVGAGLLGVVVGPVGPRC